MSLDSDPPVTDETTAATDAPEVSAAEAVDTATTETEASTAPLDDTGTDAAMVTALGVFAHETFEGAISNLSVILNQEIAPQATEATSCAQASDAHALIENAPAVVAHVGFTGGLSYETLFLLSVEDAKFIASMMLGGAGGDSVPGTLNELENSAINEAFNQMMNASAMQLSEKGTSAVEVSGMPEVVPFDLETLPTSHPAFADGLIAVPHQLKLNDEQTIQLVELFIEASVPDLLEQATRAADSASMDPNAVITALAEEASAVAAGDGGGGASLGGDGSPVTVQPVQFSPFDNQPEVSGASHKNLDLVMDVTLNLTVQLGATELSIKEILELTRGSVIELDRIAGESVDLLANGKLIAKGEVVVIEDNFGLRITSIVSPQDRLKGLSAIGG